MQTFKKILRRQDRSELLNQGLCAAMVLVTVTVAFVMANLEPNLHPRRIHTERTLVRPGGDLLLP
jgi:hypothetical protein